jgi:hypothetical protein
MPETPEGFEKMMADWKSYFGNLEASGHQPDIGAPLGERAVVCGGAPTGVNGYSIVHAKDLAEAKALTSGHPHLGAEGAIEIAEFSEM